VFKEEIDRLEPPLLDGKRNEKNRDIERAVIMHEMGHLLGVPHIDNKACVMHPDMNTTRFYEEVSENVPRDFCAESEGHIMNALMGIDETELDRTVEKNVDTVQLKVVFDERCKLGSDDCWVKAEYWYEGQDPEEIELEGTGKTYRATLAPYTAGTTLHYRIMTRDQTEYEQSGSVITENTDLIKQRKNGTETPFPGMMSVSFVLIVVFLFHVIKRNRMERQDR